ncbi:sodium-dependent transporter [Hydrogenovibrio kuenenii]|uniref:sodium-dependent transporter n=1 Tax=Hydrogenovibrio kuenenii TaxID=63658 RepID=UPI000467E140|nr:sodium-dependent transporter [Hydrogenovibrio kuenenii]
MSRLKLSTTSWTTQTAFIMAATGSAVGLGNLWKFPYITGENGGGAFVLVYLLCVLLIGLPVLIAEITLGRRGGANPPQALSNLAKESKASKWWWLLGLNGLLAGCLILSFYTVIAGWGVAYFFESLSGDFINISAKSVSTNFSSLIANPWQLAFWHTVAMLITVYIVSKGVKGGLEKAVNIMMPGLFIILLILLGYAASTDAFAESFHFLFYPDFSKLTWQGVLVAMGHAFFTLSVGMGTMMVYGSYLSKDYSIPRAGLWIALIDTLVALIAGLVIFSVVFANHLHAGSGPGLLFQTLPVAFGKMSGGWFFGTLFFALVVLAALSSAISLIEPAASWLEQNWGIKRLKATVILGLLTWVLGLGTVLSFNEWKSVHFIGDRTLFDSLDFLTTNIMLPLGGLLMAVFVAWVMTQQQRDDEMEMPSPWKDFYRNVLKFITPTAILIVFIYNLL